ncbi:hypothetical protein pclt_cds_833 [Pandoravirus celtis]|uniref:F-box incomplete domain containing protein n=1 Tax=Pandoravirus celtis TaxID=2568002 RepID=A0A4D6EHY6_9VIRU|nr:hypothetical protein pclt_cds_833 [Pandoravirus celtis]
MADIDDADAMAVEPMAPTLADLPSEIRDGIVRLLTKPRDLAAVRCASRLFDGGDMEALTVRWAARYMFALVESRAPLRLIATAVSANRHLVGFDVLHDAVVGGRMDVVRLVHATIEERVPAPVPSAPYELVSIIMAALGRGHIGIARYLVNRAVAGVRHDALDDVRLARAAARSGYADAMAFAHDRLPPGTGIAPCDCTWDLGDRAWRAPLPGAALWLKDHDCAGYTAPTAEHLASAIDAGRDGMLPAILAEIDPALAVPSVEIDRALYSASTLGSLATVTIAMEAGLVPRPLPLFVGAGASGHIALLDYAEARFGTPQDAMRGAVMMAAESWDRGHDTVRWVATRRPDVIDATIMWMAIARGPTDVVRAIDDALAGSFDWQRAAFAVLKSQNAKLLRYAVEEKGMVVDAMSIQGRVRLTAKMTKYLISRYGVERMQPVLDAVSIINADQERGDWSWLDAVSGACTAARCVATSVRALYAEARSGEPKPCACRRCQEPDGPRPAKRQCMDPSNAADAPHYP